MQAFVSPVSENRSKQTIEKKSQIVIRVLDSLKRPQNPLSKTVDNRKLEQQLGKYKRSYEQYLYSRSAYRIAGKFHWVKFSLSGIIIFVVLFSLYALSMRVIIVAYYSNKHISVG